MTLAWTVLGLGLLVLVVGAVATVPRQPVALVTDADVERDFTAAEQGREKGFRRRVRRWGLLSTALDAAVPTVLVLSGTSASLTRSVGGPWWVGALVTTGVLLLASRVLTVPCAVVVRRASLEVGLAAGTWVRWCRDLALASLLGWAFASAAVVAWVAAARAWPQWWWCVVALGAAVVVVVLSFLLPVVVEPLFATFAPLADGPLRSDLLALAEADGVRVRDVLVADASRRTTALNAYVSGLGATRRIVVHDTLLDRGRDDEVRAVVAHELGHVVAHDVRTGTVLGAVAAGVAVVAISLAIDVTWVRDLVHVSGPDDPAVAGVLLLAGIWASLLSAPLSSAVSRRIERRADLHCLDRTEDPACVARMHRSLALVNLAPLRPPRLLHLWFGTHPTSPERIATARAWALRHGVEVPGDLAPPPSSA